MVRLIDDMHLGRDRVIGAHLVRGLIVDPGPASALDGWIDGFEEAARTRAHASTSTTPAPPGCLRGAFRRCAYM